MLKQRLTRPHGLFQTGITARTDRWLSFTHCFHKKDQLPPKPTLPDHELHHVYLKGSGPGGQKINKTNSAVQLTHLPTGVVVKSQATRSRSQNHNIARRILAEKIDLLEKGSESRVAKKEERTRKKKASASKKSKRKYRQLDDAKQQTSPNSEDDLEEDERTDNEEVEERLGGLRSETKAMG